MPKTSNFKKILPFIFVLWLIDIILTFVIKGIFTGSLSSGTDGAPILSHQIRMSVRIIIAFMMSGILFSYIKKYTNKDLVLTGASWLFLLLCFEWGGGIFMAGRSIEDMLLGWNIFKGYFWPYVLFGMFLAPIVMGKLLERKRLKIHNPKGVNKNL